MAKSVELLSASQGTASTEKHGWLVIEPSSPATIATVPTGRVMAYGHGDIFLDVRAARLKLGVDTLQYKAPEQKREMDYRRPGPFDHKLPGFLKRFYKPGTSRARRLCQIKEASRPGRADDALHIPLIRVEWTDYQPDQRAATSEPMERTANTLIALHIEGEPDVRRQVAREFVDLLADIQSIIDKAKETPS